MAVSGQVHAPATLSRGKVTLLPIKTGEEQRVSTYKYNHIITISKQQTTKLVTQWKLNMLLAQWGTVGLIFFQKV